MIRFDSYHCNTNRLLSLCLLFKLFRSWLGETDCKKPPLFLYQLTVVSICVYSFPLIRSWLCEAGLKHYKHRVDAWNSVHCDSQRLFCLLKKIYFSIEDRIFTVLLYCSSVSFPLHYSRPILICDVTETLSRCCCVENKWWVCSAVSFRGHYTLALNLLLCTCLGNHIRLSFFWERCGEAVCVVRGLHWCWF